MNMAVSDAARLCWWVYSSISPNDKWVFVNIAKTPNEIFTYPSLPEIPTSFGYSYDKVPQILEEAGVIMSKRKARWFIGIKTNYDGYKLDPLNNIARLLGIISEKETIEFYVKHHKTYSNYGPNPSGQYAIALDVAKMVNFYNQAKGYTPAFTENTLKFLSEEVTFEGELTIRSVKLLVEKVNTIVSNKQLLEVDESENYDDYVKDNKLTEVGKKLKDRMDSIKDKIDKNPALKNALLIARKNGWGMFVNRAAIPITPQIDNINPPS